MVFIIVQPNRTFVDEFFPFFEVVYTLEVFFILFFFVIVPVSIYTLWTAQPFHRNLRLSMCNLVMQALVGSTSRLIFIYNQYAGAGPQQTRPSVILATLLRIAMAETFVAMFFFLSVERVIATFAWSWYEKASPRTLIVFAVLETCAILWAWSWSFALTFEFISTMHFLIGIVCSGAVGGTVDFFVVVINYRFYRALKCGAQIHQYSVARAYQIHENVVILKALAKIGSRMVMINIPLFLLAVYQYFMLGEEETAQKMLFQAVFDLLIAIYPASMVTFIPLSDVIFEKSLKRLPHGNQLFRFCSLIHGISVYHWPFLKRKSTKAPITDSDRYFGMLEASFKAPPKRKSIFDRPQNLR